VRGQRPARARARARPAARALSFFPFLCVFRRPPGAPTAAPAPALTRDAPPRPPPGAYSSTYHPDWSVLAARIVVSDLHKQTEASFSKNSTRLYNYTLPKTGKPCPLLADDVYAVIQANAARLDAAIDYTRDFE